MKNRWLLVLLALILVAVPLFGACKAAPAETIKLSYSNFFPPTHFHSILAEEWIKEIETRTEGMVEITYYPGGSLVGAVEMYDGVAEGITDIGMSCLTYTMGRFPACELVDLPHGYPNGWVPTMVANDFYNKFRPAELDDTHVLYFHAHGPGVVFTTKKPVRKLEDMAGLVLRSTGVGCKIAEALGAEGYGAGKGEAHELMSKGVTDGEMTPREVLVGWGEEEVVKYVTGCYDVSYTTDMFVVMNNDKWDALPGNIKKIFTEVSEEWIEKHGMVWDYYDGVAVNYWLDYREEMGDPGELIELPAAEMARWVEAVKVVKDEYMAEKGAMELPVADYEEYLNERVAHWSEKSPTTEECIAWVETNLVPLKPE
jgi:TRAP-type C4-dicarboxylate transport system substrate-binding protein